MDIADAAQVQIDALTAHPTLRPEGPAPTGRCLYCGDPVEGTLRWCDTGCRDDDLYEQDRLRALGRTR